MPGIWLRKDGGCLVRVRAKDGTTGKLKEIFKVMPEAIPATALTWLNDERARVREGIGSAPSPKLRSSEFAAQLLEHKVTVRDLKSAKGRKKRDGTLEHLVKGTKGKKSGRFVRGFGEPLADTSFRVALAAWARRRQHRRSRSAPLRSFPRMASNTTFQKRQKERARLDKQRDKSEEKKLRREQPNARVTSEPGVDPDIAGIIPGPQPVPDEFL